MSLPSNGRGHDGPVPTTLILASRSPARLALLRAAGIEPVIAVSDVDEDALTASLPTRRVGDVVSALAKAKAEDVARRASDGGLVIGCDSMFTIDDQVWGKPTGAPQAVERIRSMRGREGVLHTGHHLIDLAGAGARSAVVSTVVRFAPMTDAEVDAYVATGEPLQVAGSFTLDGRSAPFVDEVVGDHTNVIGLSLPTLRRMVEGLGRSITDLWT